MEINPNKVGTNLDSEPVEVQIQPSKQKWFEANNDFISRNSWMHTDVDFIVIAKSYKN